MSSSHHHDEVKRSVRAIADALECGQTMTAPLETDLANACRRAVIGDVLALCARLGTRFSERVLAPLVGQFMRMLEAARHQLRRR